MRYFKLNYAASVQRRPSVDRTWLHIQLKLLFHVYSAFDCSRESSVFYICFVFAFFVLVLLYFLEIGQQTLYCELERIEHTIEGHKKVL